MSTDLQNEIQNIVIEQYQKNMNFLQINFPDVYEDVVKSQNEEPRYFLELKDNSYFDIYDEEQKCFLHGVNTYDEATKRSEVVNFDASSSLNLLKIDTQNNNLAKPSDLISLSKLINHLNENIKYTDLQFNQIYKFIFIGTGIGLHIQKVYEKIKPMNTLIIEPSLEIFRLSLFTCDYTQFQIDNKKLFLCIGKKANELEQSLNDFTLYHSYMNFNIKHHLFKVEQKEYLESIQNFYSRTSPIDFPYLVSLNMAKRTYDFMKNDSYFINTNKMNINKPLENKKILIIAAGPSLDEKIQWIKENQDKFIIVCVDVILKKLEKNSIIPDIIVSIDPHVVVNNFFDTENKEYLKNSTIIFLSQQHEEVIKKISHLNYCFFQSYHISNNLGMALSIPNVGSFSMFMSYVLGAKEIYTIGTDAAFNQITGKRYSEDTSVEHNVNLKDTEETKSTISLSDTLITKGNLKKEVETTRDLIRFKYDFEYLISYFMNSNEFKLFNLSNGAYIEGLTPLETKDIDLNKLDIVDKVSIKKLIKESCDNKFTDIDFTKDISILNEILNEVKNFRAKKFKTKDDLQKNKIDFLIWTLNKKKEIKGKFINHIFLLFTDLIDIYYNFALNINQKDLYSKNYLKKVHQYWCDALIELLEIITFKFKN